MTTCSLTPLVPQDTPLQVGGEKTWFLVLEYGNMANFLASCRLFKLGERNPDHTIFPYQGQDSAGMPLQMAGFRV